MNRDDSDFVFSALPKRFWMPTLLALAILPLTLLGARSTRAELIGYWPLDETSGTTTPNLGTGTGGPTDGTLLDGLGVEANGPFWITDATRGQVLGFDGANDYVDAGDIPSIGINDDFTWAFWTYNEQGANNDVILGNRVEEGTGWTKFTTNKFEYRSGGQNADIDYADIALNQWVHHAVVKSGATMTYYRDGANTGLTSTATAVATAQPFYLGGDSDFAESWQGRLDDVAVWNEALTAEQIAGLADGSLRPNMLVIPEPGTLTLVVVAGLLAAAGMVVRRRR